LPALKGALGCYKFKDDREVEKSVTRWLVTKKHGIQSPENRNVSPMTIVSNVKFEN
jgi:hypothetical protein